jgi:hypothetical protein
MTFNYVDYLYFNPELQAFSNVVDIEDAMTYLNNIPNASNLIPNVNSLPIIIDPVSILSTNRDTLPMSYFNTIIRHAMSNEGISLTEIISKSKYIPSIRQQVSYLGSNMFQANDPSFVLSSNNLHIGDSIRVLDPLSSELFMNVENISTNTFIVAPTKYNLDIASNYILDGIRLVDPLRVAKIGLVRNYATLPQAQSNIVPESGTFNATLYKLLYPDAARFNDQEAYADFISKRKASILRINNAEDILGNFVETSNNKITGVNILIDPNNPADSNRLVSEYGIRQYTNSLFSAIGQQASFSQVVIASNLTATGPATFCNDVQVLNTLKVSNSSILTGNVTMCNNLRVMKPAYFNSNVFIDKNALVYGNLSVAGTMYNPRLGIGYVMDSNSPSSNVMYNGSNVGIGISNPTEVLEVNGNIKTNTGSIYVIGGSLGIGLSNPSYQLQLSQDSAAKPSSTTWTVSSDRRLKKNIRKANCNRCYDIVKNLNLMSYTWDEQQIRKEQVSDRNKLGWIAQDVEEYFPKAVRQTNMYGLNDCKTLDTDQIYASMYGAIQQLQQMVEQLQSENIILKSKISELFETIQL